MDTDGEEVRERREMMGENEKEREEKAGRTKERGNH